MSRSEITEARGGEPIPLGGGVRPPRIEHVPGKRGKGPLWRRAWVGWTALSLAASAGLGVGIYKAVSGQESGQNPVDTTGIVTTVPTLPENTTIPPASTTTTEALTTTSTEVKQTTGVDEEFISKTETYKDVEGKGDIKSGKLLLTANEVAKEKPKEGTYIIVDPSKTVDPDLQAEFRASQDVINRTDKAEILWVGDKNDKDKMNAVITNKAILYEVSEAQDANYEDYVGGVPEFYNIWKKYFNSEYPQQVIGIFDSVIPSVSPEEPDTKDFYIKLDVPLLDQKIYVRACVETPFYYKPKDVNFTVRSFLFVNNLQETYQDQVSFNSLDAPNILENFLAKHALSEFMQPGDKLVVNLAGLGDAKLTRYTDIRGIPMVASITVEASRDEFNRISALIR